MSRELVTYIILGSSDRLKNIKIPQSSSTEEYIPANLEINGNSFDVIKQLDALFDVIYLDPMYPILKHNIKKSGELNAIRSILEIENLSNDEDSMINDFMRLDYKKIILKRPLKSKKIYSNINYQVKGRTTRFDIYL